MRGAVVLVVMITSKEDLEGTKVRSAMLNGWDLRVGKVMRFIACSQDSEGYNLTSEQQLLAGSQNECGWRRDLDSAGSYQAARSEETRTYVRTGAQLPRNCTNAMVAVYAFHIT
jgi:hypothetical protein